MYDSKRDSLVGRIVLGNYLIEAKVGRGAMGSIYRGRHRTLGRKVAVKVLRHHLLSDEDERRRFHDEAEAVARLTHPNVVTILDFGTIEKGAPCIVTEFIAGETLLDILETEGPIEPWRATTLIQQALSALIEAHAAGIIHRDIKSDNIMVQRLQDGREQVKLVDFGVSLVEGRQNTDAGFIFGTPLYMSPEQCQGMRPDRRADLYSLGVVFFEILSGEPLFALEDPYDFLKAHVHQQPPLCSQVAEQPIPETLDEIIARLLQKNPKDRFQSAQEVKQALHGWEISRKATESGRSAETWSKMDAVPAGSGTTTSKAIEAVHQSVAQVADIEEVKKVLVVEGDREAARVLKGALQRLDLSVALADSPQSALELVAEGMSYDLYLIAHVTAGNTESALTTLVTHILSRDPLAEIVAMAGFSQVEEISKHALWHVSDFLIKPFRSFAAFSGRIRAALKRRETNLLQTALIQETIGALERSSEHHPVTTEIQRALEKMAKRPAHIAGILSAPAVSALQQKKHRVSNAASSKDLSRHLARRGLHVVLLESAATDESLFELTAEVISRRPDLEVLLVGFAHELGEMLECVELGATDFVVKPHENLDVLVLKTELAVARRRRRLKIRKLSKTLENLAETTARSSVRKQLDEIRKALSDTLILEAEPAEADVDTPLSGLSGTPTALIFEPDRMVRNLLARSLEAVDWHCHTVANGAEALHIAKSRELDFILLAEPSAGSLDDAPKRWRDIAAANPQTPLAFVGQPLPDHRLPAETVVGQLDKPLAGLAQISTLAARALARRKQLLQLADPPNAAETQKSDRSEASVHHTLESTDPPSLRVLLIEDDPRRSERMKSIFTAHRCPMLIADNLERAVYLLERYELDVVVVNLSILVAAVEAQLDETRSANPDLPLVVYADRGGRDQALSALSYGATAFGAAPWSDPDAFISRIKTVIRTQKNP